MLQLNQTAYTPTGSGFSLSLLKLFRLKFSFWHLPMETRTWAGINSSVNLFQKLFRMSLNTTKESCLNTHDTCHGRTQPPWIKRMLLLAAPVLYAIHCALKLCISTWCEHFTHPTQSTLPSNSAYHCLFHTGAWRGEVICPATKSVRSRGEICNLGSTYADY